MKIKNLDGRSWISKWSRGLPLDVIHITNAEVESAEVKGNSLVIKLRG